MREQQTEGVDSERREQHREGVLWSGCERTTQGECDDVGVRELTQGGRVTVRV